MAYLSTVLPLYYFKYFLDENNQLTHHTNTNTINSKNHIEALA